MTICKYIFYIYFSKQLLLILHTETTKFEPHQQLDSWNGRREQKIVFRLLFSKTLPFFYWNCAVLTYYYHNTISTLILYKLVSELTHFMHDYTCRNSPHSPVNNNNITQTYYNNIIIAIHKLIYCGIIIIIVIFCGTMRGKFSAQR